MCFQDEQEEQEDQSSMSSQVSDVSYQKWTGANFYVGIDPFRMNDTVTERPFCVVKVPHRCHCYDSDYRDPELFLIQDTGFGISCHDLIEEMILMDYTPRCEHNLLSDFRPIEDGLLEAVFSIRG